MTVPGSHIFNNKCYCEIHKIRLTMTRSNYISFNLTTCYDLYSEFSKQPLHCAV